MDCSLPGTSVHGDSPGKNIGAGCHALLQGIFPTQGLNPGLPHCRRILNHLSHQGSPRILEWVAYSFSRGEIPHSGIEPGSPALQADSLPAELPGKPPVLYSRSVLVFYFVYSSMYMSVPVSQFISCFSFGNHKFNFYICDSIEGILLRFLPIPSLHHPISDLLIFR